MRIHGTISSSWAIKIQGPHHVA